MSLYGERGYLIENYRLFHIASPLTEEVDFHYHTFHKIVIPLKGALSYMIEGIHYRLEAYLLQGHRDLRICGSYLFCYSRQKCGYNALLSP